MPKLLRTVCAILALMLATLAASAQSGPPIKVGFSMALTGAVAQNGKQLIIALELWRDDVNAHGGLLGRPVQLVYYDDQSNPSNVPGIYTKLITVDKVDLLLGPYATNMAAPAVPVIMQHNMMTVSILAIAVNRHFNYPRYFDMVTTGPDGMKAFSKGFFDLAAAQEPKPQTVAVIAADTEFSKTSADGAKENAAAGGLNLVYDASYPPTTTDYAPVMRAVQAAKPDVVFVAAYPPDTVGIVRAAAEIGFTPKMFGGTMIGLLITPIKVQLGPLLDGLVIMQSFVPQPPFAYPGVVDVLKRYSAKAAGEKIDPYGYGFVPFGYAAGQVLAQAVAGAGTLDNKKLAEYTHSHTLHTVVGDITYNAAGEWSKSRNVFTQFQNVAEDNIAQFGNGSVEPILWPDEIKTGTMIYPYQGAPK